MLEDALVVLNQDLNEWEKRLKQVHYLITVQVWPTIRSKQGACYLLNDAC